MSKHEPFDPLLRFAEIERLVSKIYYRFSHLFLDQPELRDFWWEMARDEEQHASILFACKALIDNYDDESLDPEISRAKADELKDKLLTYLSHGTPDLRVEDAFRIALQIESSEIDAIYSKLLQLGGPHIAKTMAASAMIRRFSEKPTDSSDLLEFRSRDGGESIDGRLCVGRSYCKN